MTDADRTIAGLLLLGAGYGLFGWSEPPNEAAARTSARGFTMAALPPDWRPIAVSGDAVVGWSNGRASIRVCRVVVPGHEAFALSFEQRIDARPGGSDLERDARSEDLRTFNRFAAAFRPAGAGGG